jgi:hypothetical protein
MRNSLWKLLSVTVLTTGALILVAPPAQAQGSCAPLSGVVYGYTTEAGWQMEGNFTIGREVYRATVLAVNTSLIGDPLTDDVWQGTETWTWRFGKGNTIQLLTGFVTEHANLSKTDPGAFHVNEVGTFANGTGMLRHAYGSLLAQGPFGPNVKLPDQIQLPAPLPEGTWFFVAPTQGMICGLNDRDER